MNRDRKVPKDHCVTVHCTLVREKPNAAFPNMNAFNVDNTRFEEAVDWCYAAPYDSRFDMDQDDVRAITDTRFRFTDPNVALEFKMRFGGAYLG